MSAPGIDKRLRVAIRRLGRRFIHALPTLRQIQQQVALPRARNLEKDAKSRHEAHNKLIKKITIIYPRKLDGLGLPRCV